MRGLMSLLFTAVFLTILYSMIYSAVGLRGWGACYLAGATILAIYALSEVEVRLCERRVEGSVVKPILIDVEGNVIHQEIEFKVSSRSKVLLNLGGAAAPLLTSLASLAALRFMGALNLEVWGVMTLFLTVAYNRLAVMIRGKGVGIPLATGIALTVITAELLNASGLAKPEALALITFSASAIAAFLGIDVLNLRRIITYTTRRVVLGGLGMLDAVVLLPTISSAIAGLIGLPAIHA